MTVRKSSKKTGRKSVKVFVPKSNVGNDQSEKPLKAFAPISVERPDESNVMPEWLRLANENHENIVVTRNQGHSQVLPSDPFHHYYKNHRSHHVWTDTAVVRRGTRVDQEVISKYETNLKTEQDMLQYNQTCLDNPEDYFLLKKSDDMGYGVFAKQDIAESLFIYFFVYIKINLIRKTSIRSI